MDNDRGRKVFDLAPLWKAAHWVGFAAATYTIVHAFREWVDVQTLRTLLLVVTNALLVGLFVLGILRSRRPVVEISSSIIEHGPLLRPMRKQIRREEVAEIAKIAPGRIVLRTHTGKLVTIWLVFIARAQRDVARASIENWVGRPRHASSTAKP